MATDHTKSDRRLTLNQIFGSDLTIVIPDMQRDYCWGSSLLSAQQQTGVLSQNKAAMFVSGIINLMHYHEKVQLGLLYGYTSAQSASHIMIIDGQQRLTTLYLLIGMLYRRTPTPQLRQLLISDYELTDDREPRLLYQVRTEAMYFMSDLVTNFFLDRNGRLSQIEHSPWYYHTYSSDPTVQNFIGALRQIDGVLEQASQEPGWDWDVFALTVAEKLEFIYHDLGSRSEAERMFITINTTGEPLTLPQHVKTMITGSAAVTTEQSLKMMQQWEEIERWGWLHRDRSRSERPTTSDFRVEQMIRIWLADTPKDWNRPPVQLFGDLYSHFKAYATLTELVPKAFTRTALSADDLLVLLPTLAYIRKWNIRPGAAAPLIQGVRDIWQWLDNLTRYIKATASGSDTQATITLIRQMPKPDITYLLGHEKPSNAKVLNPEEICKLRLIASCDDRKRVMRIIDKAQRHPMLSGRVAPVIGWCKTSEGTDLGRLERYVNAIYEVWGTDILHQPGLDHLRRALLTLRHPKYPISRRGDTSLSLCWHDYDWQRLMSTAPGLIRQLLDKVMESPRPTIDTLKRMAQRFKDIKNPYFFIINDETLLSACHKRMLLKPSAPFLGFYVESKGKKTGNPVGKQWYVEQSPLLIDPQSWHTIRQYGSRCLYTDHLTINLAIDLYWVECGQMPYRIEVFSRKERQGPNTVDIRALLESQGFSPEYDRKSKRLYLSCRNATTAVHTFNTLATLKHEIDTFVIES